MEKFRFLDWEVYKEARALTKLVFNVVRKIPKEFHFELGSQIIRSTFSIVLNIAEGSGKASDAELRRFINIALGSANETLAAADILRYNGFITDEEYDAIESSIIKISRQLGGFKKTLVISHKS